MALTAEQQVLMTGIADRVTEIQGAIKRALPGNAALHAEFKVGSPAPKTVAETLELGRTIAPLAKENRALLVGRGVDAMKITHLAQMIANLEKLAAQPAPAPVEPAASAPEEAEAPKKGRKKKA
jgi:hypothetical protein